MLITLPMWPRRGRNRTGSRTAPKPYLNDEQWNLIADLFPHPPMTTAGGRPRVPPRACLEGVLWILVSGARWKDLPERYPSPSTCWRRLKEWTESGVFCEAWKRLLGRLDALGGIDWEEAIGDGTFSPGKKGAPRSATPRRAKAPS
jgi:transposase